MKFQFGDLNAYHHRHMCIELNWQVFDLPNSTNCQMKTSPKFPAIKLLWFVQLNNIIGC